MTSPTPQGGLTIRLQDSPFDDMESVLVTFSEVGAQRSGEGSYARVPFVGASATRTCDVKRLEGGRNELLATGSVAEGRYTGMRVIVTGAFADPDDRTPLPACASSVAPPRGAVPVPVVSGEVGLTRDFEIRAGSTTTITLDFLGGDSLRVSGGGFVLRPVIGVASISGP